MSAVAMIGMMLGTHTLVVGLEDAPDGALKVYLGARWKGIYVLIDDPDAQAEVRRAWADTRSHVLVPIPPAEALHRDEERT